MEDKKCAKLSVIIPVYNSEDTLLNCVDSILHNAGADLEIILVDDGSGEACSTLCDALAEKHPGIIRVIHQQNAGSFAARMRGAADATGEYILYVDADDLLLENAVLRIQGDISDGADFYMYDYIMDAVGGKSAKRIRLMEYPVATEFSADSKHLVSQVFMNGMMNTVCATAIRRDFLLGMKLHVPEKKIRNGEDRLQKMQMIVHAQRVAYVPTALYHYKWYPSSQGGNLRTGHFTTEMYEDMKIVWCIERENYQALGFDENQCLVYDSKKLSRICGLLENAWSRKLIDRGAFDDVFLKLRNDSLFNALASREAMKRARNHTRWSAWCIHRGYKSLLKMYWRACHLVRGLR